MTTVKRSTRVQRSGTVTRRKKAYPPERAVSGYMRPLHKKILLHPLAVFGLMCLGVLLVASTLDVNAASFTVNGVLPAPPLTSPATIDLPTDGSVITSAPITVKGSCPYQSYVDLMRNGYFSGSAICQSSGSYEIVSDLTPGSNTLQVQDYNVTNQVGPVSPSITVDYQPPPAPPNTTSSPSSSSTSSGGTVEVANSPNPNASTQANHSGLGPLLLTAGYSYHAFTTVNNYTWSFNLTGGTPPYVVDVAWGDGASSSLYFRTDPTFTIQHKYVKTGTFNILVTAIDSLGEKAVLQLSTVIRAPQNVASVGTVKASGSNPGDSSSISALDLLRPVRHYLWIIWPAYGIVMLMVFSFWLGERRELQLVTVSGKRPRRNARHLHTRI